MLSLHHFLLYQTIGALFELYDPKIIWQKSSSINGYNKETIKDTIIVEINKELKWKKNDIHGDVSTDITIVSVQ